MKASISPFLEYKKSSDIHGTVTYPAVMVAPVMAQLFEKYLKTSNFISICDPFVGSGTSLYEAHKIKPELDLYGNDINPLAILITSVKMNGVDSASINEDIEQISTYLLDRSKKISHQDFFGKEKWFKDDIAISLSKIGDAIGEIDNTKNRRYFWYMVIDIVRKFSNTRSSTFKLHIRSQEQIDRINNNVIKDYLKKIRDELAFFETNEIKDCFLTQSDALYYLKSCKTDAFSVICTSPPYGDNSTTVPYGEYSILPLRWMDPRDLSIKGWELRTNSAIDNQSLGGLSHSSSKEPFKYASYYSDHDDVREDKLLRIQRFLNGYFDCIYEINRTAEKMIILTLGNRTVDGKKVPLIETTKQFLCDLGWSCAEDWKRDIPKKRMPSSISRINGHPVRSMKDEHTLVFEKG